MLIPRLATRNILGVGLRTWLNAIVLSLVFVLIIWVQGVLEGMARYAKDARIDFEIGGGMYWHEAYDPYDPLTFEDAHGPLPPAVAALVDRGEATPMLVATGAIFPEGRIRGVVLRGIDPGQRIIDIPSRFLAADGGGAIPAMIGEQMARQTRLGVGDYVTVRWRDAGGTFDADDIRIVQIMQAASPSVDVGQIWLPLERMREMFRAPGEASVAVIGTGVADPPEAGGGWAFHDLDDLLADIEELIRMKSNSANIVYGLLLFMGLLAVFDTQVLAIWRRRREIGTLVALGMRRATVVGLFTLEGAMHGVLALLLGAVYGVPLLWLSRVRGLPMPEMAGDWGIAIPPALYPYYGLRLVVATTLIVLVTVTIVSYLPASKISRMRPTDALRGKAS
ncbi:MAG: ABC transporter permease [Candidatus Krumholzibacteriota bacterium]|nr:ABC transporter permease [Candidatus Krumholzibacteriota bacterium]